MVQNIMAHLMAKDEERLRGGGFLNRRIPDDYALGGAKPSHISIESRDLFAGLHQEHAVAGNVEAAFRGYPFDLRDQFRIVFFQWLKLVKERINHVGRDQDEQEKKRHCDEPEVEPPPARTPANQPDH